MGQLWAALDPRPKMMFAAHEKLYDFHLEVRVIRSLDQWVISLQNDNVSGLTRFKPCLIFLALRCQTWSNEF
jgi:hypothetical protein